MSRGQCSPAILDRKAINGKWREHRRVEGLKEVQKVCECAQWDAQSGERSCKHIEQVLYYPVLKELIVLDVCVSCLLF